MCVLNNPFKVILVKKIIDNHFHESKNDLSEN